MNYKLFYICLSITRIKSFVIFAYVLVSEINWEYAGIEQMLHPAYSLGLALLLLLNYYLFQSMVHFLLLWCFNKQEGVESSVKRYFTSKDKNLYQCVDQRTGRKVASDGATQ